MCKRAFFFCLAFYKDGIKIIGIGLFRGAGPNGVKGQKFQFMLLWQQKISEQC